MRMTQNLAGISLHLVDAAAIRTDVHGQIWLTDRGLGAIFINHLSSVDAMRKLAAELTARADALTSDRVPAEATS